MRKIFVLFFLTLSVFSYADAENIDVETNISIIENNMKINQEEFDKLVEQVKQRYNDFDWVGFDNLSIDAKRMVIRNYLARIAFEEVKQNFIDDIYMRAKDGVTVEKEGNETNYFNTSDVKYRTLYLSEKDLITKAGSKCKTCDKMGHFKQTDVKLFDDLIAQETAKAPVDIYCEKYCLEETNEIKSLADELRNALEEFEKANREYILETQKSEHSRKKVREKRKKLRKAEKEYNYLLKVNENSNHRRWSINPYNKECQTVAIGCWNVEQRPEKYEKYELNITEYPGDNLIDISYDYDDVLSNTHINADAYSDCNCSGPLNQLDTLIYCDCHVGFYDMIQDFTAVRNWENQDRIDTKNGKFQDHNENGGWYHDWESNHIPMGSIYGHTLSFYGNYQKTETKREPIEHDERVTE